MNDLATLVARARAGTPPTARELHLVLARERRAERLVAVRTLLPELARFGDHRRQLQLLELAWSLGDHDPHLLPLLIQGLRTDGRPRDALDRIRECAWTCARQNDLAALIDCVALANEVAFAAGVPAGDPIVTRCLQDALRPHAIPARDVGRGRPLRIGYVFWGETNRVAGLPWLFMRIAENHDRRRYEPVFFSEWPRTAFTEPRARQLIAAVERLGSRLVTSDCASVGAQDRTLGRAVALAENIARENIDLTIFQSQHAVFLATALLRPSPIIASFDHGNPYTYASPALDACFGAHDRFTIEHRCDSILIPQSESSFLPSDLPEGPPIPRASLHIPKDATVIATAGMPAKFAAQVRGLRDYVGMVLERLADNPSVHWVIAGIRREDVPHLPELLDPGVAGRVHLLGLTEGLTPLLSLADVYLDTWPVSGGLSVYEAMRRGIATVTYRFYFDGIFDLSRQYSALGDYLDGTELLVEAPEVEPMAGRLHRLLSDASYRHALGRAGAEAMRAHSDIPRFTRACEHAYERLVSAHRHVPASANLVA